MPVMPASKDCSEGKLWFAYAHLYCALQSYLYISDIGLIMTKDGHMASI